MLCSSSSDGCVDGEADDQQQQDVEDAEDGQPAVLGALTNQIQPSYHVFIIRAECPAVHQPQLTCTITPQLMASSPSSCSSSVSRPGPAMMSTPRPSRTSLQKS